MASHKRLRTPQMAKRMQVVPQGPRCAPTSTSIIASNPSHVLDVAMRSPLVSQVIPSLTLLYYHDFIQSKLELPKDYARFSSSFRQSQIVSYTKLINIYLEIITVENTISHHRTNVNNEEIKWSNTTTKTTGYFQISTFNPLADRMKGT